MKVLLVPAVLVGLGLGVTAAPKPVTSGVTYEEIGRYDVPRLNQILTTERQEFSDFSVAYPPAKYAVKLYRVIYPSVIPEQGNRPTVASGLLAVPETGRAEMPVLSYQHGTVFTKTAVPSRPEESMETRLMIANFAGQGYAVIAADYFGKGESIEKDSYLVKASTQQACFDHLRATQAVSADLGVNWGPLFLSGWSQGGWATMSFLNKLESVGVPVKAAATASAPNDVFALVTGWIYAPSKYAASYLNGAVALQVFSCSEYYGMPGLPGSIIRPEYLETAGALYRNEITWEEAAKKLPMTVSEMLREDFRAAGLCRNGRYWEIMQDSQAYRWRSETPLRSFYGEIDEVTSPFIAQLPVNYWKALGGAEAVGVPAGAEANHRGTFLFGIANQKEWFDGLLSAPSDG